MWLDVFTGNIKSPVDESSNETFQLNMNTARFGK